VASERLDEGLAAGFGLLLHLAHDITSQAPRTVRYSRSGTN